MLTGGAGAAIHLVPIGLGLVPILLGFAFLLDRILALELRLLGQSTGARAPTGPAWCSRPS